MAILAAFRPGVSALTNAEIAERTQLPRSTISRLTQTLLECGFLWHDVTAGVYRLAAPILSLAHAMRLELDILNVALPMMREAAEGKRINVGLAVPDHMDMVYIESVRRNRGGLFRHVVSGSRIPMELTALGRAHMATLDPATFDAVMARLSERHSQDWPPIQRMILDAVRMVHEKKYCIVSWQSGMTSIATPLVLPGQPSYVFNMSYASQEISDSYARKELAPSLLKLTARVRLELSRPA